MTTEELQDALELNPGALVVRIKELEAELRDARRDVMIADEKTARIQTELDMANGTIDDLHRKLDSCATLIRRDL